MDKKKMHIKTTLKLFICFSILMTVLIMFYKIIFNIEINWKSSIIYVLIISIISTHHYKEKVIEIPIKNKDDFIIHIKKNLNSTLWSIITETNKSLVLKPKFDRPYSCMYKEKIIINISENNVKLTGSKLYVNKLKSIIDGEKSLFDKRFFRYFTNLVLVCIILMPILLNLDIINRIKANYNEFRLRDIETLKLEENFILGNTEGNINNYGGVVESEDYIFYVKDSLKLYRSDKNFENEIVLIDKSSGPNIGYLNVIDDWIFYSSGKTLNRIKVDGSKKETIYSLGYILDIHVLDNWIYFISYSDNSKLYKMDINGQNLHKLSNITIEDISIYDNRIYYSYEKKGQSFFESMDLNGQNKQFIANILPFDLVKDDDTLYYTDEKDFNLFKYQLNNDKEPQKLINQKISGFILVDNLIYFSGEGKDVRYPGNSLYKIDINGENRQKINNDKMIEHLSNVGNWVLFSSVKGNTLPYLKRINIKDNTIINMN